MTPPTLWKLHWPLRFQTLMTIFWKIRTYENFINLLLLLLLHLFHLLLLLLLFPYSFLLPPSWFLNIFLPI